MTQSVLLGLAELGEAPLTPLGTEDGVVAEAMRPATLGEDLALDRPLEEVRPVAINQRDDGAEAGTAGTRYAA